MVFYMAVRPAEFTGIIEKLGSVGLLKENSGWRRVVIEKPFGYDLLSAQTLQSSLYRHLNEPQIYRIDHYLGKGTVQNVMVFRFANLAARTAVEQSLYRSCADYPFRDTGR